AVMLGLGVITAVSCAIEVLLERALSAEAIPKIVTLAYSLACGALGGVVTARVAARSKRLPVAALALIQDIFIALAMVAFLDHAPLWVWASLLLAGPWAIVAGGEAELWSRSRSRRSSPSSSRSSAPSTRTSRS